MWPFKPKHNTYDLLKPWHTDRFIKINADLGSHILGIRILKTRGETDLLEITYSFGIGIGSPSFSTPIKNEQTAFQILHCLGVRFSESDRAAMSEYMNERRD